MKIKLLLLVGIGFAPSILVAQTAIFYNKGIMSVKAVSAANTTLYINGDFVAGHDDATKNCQITLSNSQTVLTGNFIHDLNGGTPAVSTVFNTGGNDATFNASRFVFRGTLPQSIKLKSGLLYGTYAPNLKGQNNIKFPTLVIENNKHVTQVPELASQASNLELNTGRLILDSRMTVVGDFTGVGPTFQGTGTSSMLSHFMVAETGTITTPNNITYGTSATDNNMFGAVQVNLELDKPSDATAAEKTGRSLVGMGVPYKKMLSDYFFWNFVMLPNNESIIGGESGAGMPNTGGNNTMTDPQKMLVAGQGFVLGVDLRGENIANYDYDLHPIYKAVTATNRPKFIDRIGSNNSTSPMANNNAEGGAFVQKQKYYFSRFGPFFKSSNNVRQANVWAGGRTLTGYDATTMSAKAGGAVSTNGAAVLNATTGEPGFVNEVLNYASIPGLPIVKGYNYYANPYTVPFDLSPITTANPANLSAWGGIRVGIDSNVAGVDFLNKVWVLDPESKGSGSYDILNPAGMGPGNKWVMVNAKYRVMKSVGPTAANAYDSGTGDVNTILAPLQMFVLYSPNGRVTAPTGFTIPASARSISSNALFLRSTSASTKLKDDFLFQISDVKTKASDRTAIVIRTPQEVMTNALYAPTRKLVTVIASDQNTTRSTVEEGAVTQTNMSTLYTKSNQGVALESNILGVAQDAASESVVLYVTPSLTAQNINITAGRLNTAERVVGIILKDKVKNKDFDLFTGKTYTTDSRPTDPVDRFTVRFVFNTSGIEDGDNTNEAKSLTSYYANGTLTVTGFDDVDFGSVVSVYDIQGRMSAQAKVNDTTVEITEPFSPGAYIVKVVGNKSYAAKFLVK